MSDEGKGSKDTGLPQGTFSSHRGSRQAHATRQPVRPSSSNLFAPPPVPRESQPPEQAPGSALEAPVSPASGALPLPGAQEAWDDDDRPTVIPDEPFGGPDTREVMLSAEELELLDPRETAEAVTDEALLALRLASRRPQPPPDLEAALGQDPVVLEEIDANGAARGASTYPPPLGQSEGHDAWTMERMQRQSTVPPVRQDDVDRLRQLSARSEPPPAAPVGGDALDLVDQSRPSQDLDLVGEMEELYALDDLTGALRFAELILGREPDNEQARRCAENCRDRLVNLYASKLGSLEQVPVHVVGESELRWLGLDHRSGFLLSRVDGISTVDELLDVCGMPRLEALRTLVELVDRGAIRLD